MCVLISRKTSTRIDHNGTSKHIFFSLNSASSNLDLFIKDQGISELFLNVRLSTYVKRHLGCLHLSEVPIS